MTVMFEIYKSPHLERQQQDAATIEELQAVIVDLTKQMTDKQRDYECFEVIAVDLAKRQEEEIRQAQATIEALRRIVRKETGGE